MPNDEHGRRKTRSLRAEKKSNKNQKGLTSKSPGAGRRHRYMEIKNMVRREPKFFTDDPVSGRPFFCGLIPRQDVEMILRDQGEFAVRKLTRYPRLGRFNGLCLSVRWDNVVHHIIVRTSKNGLCTLEKDEFESVDQLIQHYMRTGNILTQKSNAKLLIPLRDYQWLLRDNQFDPTELIGQGNFGQVWRAIFKPGENKQNYNVAIKFQKHSGVSREERILFFGECRKLRQLKHRHLVAFIGLIVDSEPVKLVMELCDDTLPNYLKTVDTSWKEKTRICLHISRGMEYITACQVIHRDLAARNCLVKQQVVKIADLGLAKVGLSYCDTSAKPIPIKWTCPCTIQNGVYTEHSDVWSFGIFTWEVLTCGQSPYLEMHKKYGNEFTSELLKYLESGERLTPPQDAPANIVKLMNECMNIQPSRRPRFFQIRRRLEDIYISQGGEISYQVKGEHRVKCEEAPS